MGCCLSCMQNLGISSSKDSYLNEFYDCSVYSNQGYHRRTMEDRTTVCLSIPNHPQYSLFGIFDGFNGFEASSYLSQNILNAVNDLDDLSDDNSIIDAINKMDQNWLQQNESEITKAGSTFVLAIIKVINIKPPEIACTERFSGNSFTIPPLHFKNVPSFSYQETPTKLQNHLRVSSQSSSINESNWYHSVATYTSTQLESVHEYNEFEVRVFWAGDSRAITIEEDYNFQSLTVDHLCSLEKEKKRIENADGKILNNRIDGIVEVSRGFGCHPMKNNKDLPQHQQKIIALAECKHVICKQNETLLMFCDGLVAPNWNNEKIVKNFKYIFEQHKNEKNSKLNCLIYLTEQAMDNGSRDNITTMSVQFK